MRAVLAILAVAALAACADEPDELAVAPAVAPPAERIQVGPQGPYMTYEELEAERMRRIQARRANGFQ